MELRKLNKTLLILAVSGGGRQSAETYLPLAEELGASRAFSNPFD
jgi:hypothetical protein